jgi:2-polyprenyl-3-methyl-5-hydroxy-6-metoxy-1,4-benzoquinol methylase
MVVSNELVERRIKNAKLTGGIANSSIYGAIQKALTTINAHGEALDFGAGAGVLTRELLCSKRFSRLHAIDITYYDNSRDRGVSWHHADLNSPLDFPDASFDTIVAAEIIEHLEKPRAVAREWARLLKPNGCLVLSTPNNESWRALLSLVVKGHFVAFLDTCYPAHITALTRLDLTRILTEAGFSIVAITFTNKGGIPKRPHVTWQAISFGLLRGLRWSDNLIVTARRN